MSAPPLRVHVLVDLRWHAGAGGHVKVWEKLAGAAGALAGQLDLTVHFSGEPGVQALGENARFRLHRPVFSSDRLPFLAPVPAHSDLAPHHPGLAAHLDEADVLHTTDAYFAFARTAERVARRRGVALVSSVHTDTPRYTAICVRETLQRVLGRAGDWLADRARLGPRAEAWMTRRLLAHQRRCAYALVSRPDEGARLAQSLSEARVGVLRRGVDHALFTPAKRDRAWLEAMGVPRDHVVVLFAARLETGKRILTVVEAVRALRAEGQPIFLVCAGAGPEAATIAGRLPDGARCAGHVDADTMARLYAAADLLATPSEVEECSNAVLEALASGLPVVASTRAGRLVTDDTGVVVGDPGVPAWTAALRALTGDHERRHSMATAARAFAERSIPSWRDVLVEDLWPYWQRAAAPEAR